MPPELEPRSPRFAATPHWIARLRNRGESAQETTGTALEPLIETSDEEDLPDAKL